MPRADSARRAGAFKSRAATAFSNGVDPKDHRLLRSDQTAGSARDGYRTWFPNKRRSNPAFPKCWGINVDIPAQELPELVSVTNEKSGRVGSDAVPLISENISDVTVGETIPVAIIYADPLSNKNMPDDDVYSNDTNCDFVKAEGRKGSYGRGRP
jgi:hypothetical protein